MSKSYQPIHQKYRPQCFDDLIGQESIAITLKQAITTNRIASAYLFSGPRGTGKTSSARIIARSLNCITYESPTIKPCGECELCKTITSGTALDVIEIDAASNTGVDNIRELIERSQFAPVQARWKVYVIDECHMLSTAAFNALLKTLEEPPQRVVFILATTDPQRVLTTILSRCQRFDFRRIALTPLKKHLTFISHKENISIEKEGIELIAKKAQGGLRDAESMLDQLSLLPQPINLESIYNLLGEIPEKELLELASSLTLKDPVSILKICRNLLDSGREPIAILQGFASILRDLIIKKLSPEYPELCNISNESQKELEDIGKQITLEDLYRWQSQLKGTEYQLRQSLQPRLWLEVLLLGLLSNSNAPVTNQVISKKEINTLNKLNPIGPDLEKSKFKNYTHLNKNNDKDKFDEEIVTENIASLNSAENNESDLKDLWDQILSSLQLPSTRMLLSQQAKLVRITKDKAVISVSSNWISMIESRQSLIEESIEKTLGSQKTLIIETELNSSIKKEISKDKNNLKGLSIKKKENQPPFSLSEKKPMKNKNIIPENPNINKSLNEISNKDIIETKARNLADFFNGEIVSLDEKDQ